MLADRFKAVSLCRSCEKKKRKKKKKKRKRANTRDRQTRRRAARSLAAPVGHGGQRVSPQRFFCLSGLFSMRPCGAALLAAVEMEEILLQHR